MPSLTVHYTWGRSLRHNHPTCSVVLHCIVAQRETRGKGVHPFNNLCCFIVLEPWSFYFALVFFLFFFFFFVAPSTLRSSLFSSSFSLIPFVTQPRVRSISKFLAFVAHSLVFLSASGLPPISPFRLLIAPFILRYLGKYSATIGNFRITKIFILTRLYSLVYHFLLLSLCCFSFFFFVEYIVCVFVTVSFFVGWKE